MLGLILKNPLQALYSAGAALLALLGVYLLGHHLGASEITAQWEIAKARQEAKQEGVATAVSSLSSQLVAAFQARLDELEHQQVDAVDVAKQADAAPVAEPCRDTRRGLPAGVVRAIDRVR